MSVFLLLTPCTSASILHTCNCELNTGEAEDAEESQGLLGQFIDYIKARKTVPLEQASAAHC